MLEDDLNLELSQDFNILKEDAPQNDAQADKFQIMAQTIQEVKDFRTQQENKSPLRNLVILDNILELLDDPLDQDKI